MKNYYLWVAGLVVLVILGLLLFKAPETSLENVDQNKNTVSDNNQNKDTKIIGKTVATKQPVFAEAFPTIFPQKGNYQCQYEEVTQSKRIQNTVYFSDGRMRAEFRTLGGSASILVYDGSYIYTWIEGQTKGTISRPKSISDFPAIVPKDIALGVVSGFGSATASWYCNPWSKDATILVKPSYLTF